MTYEEVMKLTKVELSEYMRSNFPRNAKSFSFRKKICGMGLNDADYITSCSIDKQRVACPAYRCWMDMIGRCYSTKRQDKEPHYVGVTVASEWLDFMNFRKWWLLNYKEGYQLDKDILSDSKIYGPTTCVFVPSWMNTFINDPNSGSRLYLPGVTYNKKFSKFRASKPKLKTRVRPRSPNYFDTEQEAYETWLACRLEVALDYKPEMDAIDLRIYSRIVEIIKRMK